jgi:phosphoglycolate phosphatase
MAPYLLIFDLDGTLVDSRADLCTAINLTRAHYGLPPLADSIVAGHVGDGIRKLVERSLAGHPADLDEAVALQARFYHKHLHDQTQLYPGVRAGLARLHAAGHRLAVLTNKQAEHTRALLAHFGLTEAFAAILGGGDVPRLKPDPAPVLDLMRRLGIPATRTWMIGDHRTDLETARRAGVRSVFVTYGIGQAGGEKADQTFDSFAVLTEFFLAGTSDAQGA